MSPMSPVSKSSSRSAKPAGAPDQFTGISCLLITWKSNPEVENLKELYYADMKRKEKDKDQRKKMQKSLHDIVSEKSLEKNYKILGKGEGIERILFKDKKDQLDEKDGDSYKYFLLAGTSHPYPDDTFYSVGRVPRKLLMKYLGVKMYLVRLRSVPTAPEREEWVQFRDKQVDIALACAGIVSPKTKR